MVKRVHELYEELGRKDLQAVENMEKEKCYHREDEAKSGPGPDDEGKPKTDKKK